MSAYAVNAVCYRTVHEPSFRQALQADPEGVLAGEALTDDERAALLAGDVATLYRMGALPLVLRHLPTYKLFGLDDANYNERMRAAG